MASEGDLLTDILRSVSRAFYLSLRILPPASRKPMAAAYLLARAADTIADTESLPPERRCQHLQTYVRAVREGGGEVAFSDVCSADNPETRLLRRLPDTLRLLAELDHVDRDLVTGIVTTLAQGMREDLEHFPPGRLSALPDAAALDRHTYMAAGCVGEFWTAILDRHAGLRWNSARQKELGVRFGKALQLTNVLRDLPADLRAGRCYLPLDELQRQNLSPADLLDWSNQDRTRLVFRRWLLVALDHYRAALDWLDGIPLSHLRLRLSALWPILIGVATLSKLAHGNWLHPERVKVSRPWIYRMMLLSVPGSLIPRPWVQAWMMDVEKA